MKYYTPKEMKKVFLYTDNKGTQPKYKENGYWYKLDHVGLEGLAEELSSIVLSCSTLPDNVSYVEYEQCIIGDKKGCRCANFLNDGEEFVSFDILYKNKIGRNFSDDVFKISTIQERFDYIVAFIKNETNLNIENYLKSILTLDAFILNPDRHYGNLGVIMRSDGSFKYAPIFDNGQGLGANFQITPPYLTFDEKLEALTGATISGSFETVIKTIGPGFQINFDMLTKKLSDYNNSIPLEILENQIYRYKDLLCVKENNIDENYESERNY